MDTYVTIGGIIYGILLLTAAVVKNRFTELIRIDAVLIPRPSEKTRIINLIAGLFFLIYNSYVLLK